MPYIYKIYNDINDKLYIGKTSQTIQARWEEHIYTALYRRQQRNYKLYNAIRKYGVDNFHIEEIEECPIDIIDEREMYWINKLNTYLNGYNMTEGGEGTVFYSRDKILQYWNEGYNQIQIAELMGCCRQTVAQALKASGISKEELSKYKGKSKHNKNKIINKKQEK